MVFFVRIGTSYQDACFYDLDEPVKPSKLCILQMVTCTGYPIGFCALDYGFQSYGSKLFSNLVDCHCGESVQTSTYEFPKPPEREVLKETMKSGVHLYQLIVRSVGIGAQNATRHCK